MAVNITPLTAGALGDPNNSLGSDVANSVNALIAAAQSADASIQTMLVNKSDASHSHPLATNTSSGFMSSSDKIKLDGLVASGSPDSYLLDRNNHTGYQDMATITGLVVALSNKSDTTHVHQEATTTLAGFLSSADKVKLNSVAVNASANQPDSYLLDRTNHTGSQPISTITGLSTTLASKADASHSHSVATTTVPGFMSAADKTKLDGVASGASANQSDVYLLSRSNHTGSQSISTITDLQTTLDGKAASSHVHTTATTTTSGFMSNTDKAKLDLIAAGATANQTDAQLLSRANHTGFQAMSTVTGLEAAIASLQPRLIAGSGISIDTTTWTISSTGGGGGGTSDHSALINRNAVDQHPIGSITGLSGELASKASVNHGHSEATFSVSGFMSYLDKAKLEGIAAGATVNQADSYLLNRVNHTGSQAISTVAGLQASLDGKQPLDTQLSNFVTNVGSTTTGFFKKTAANTWSFASLVSGDIPSLAASIITSGTFATARIPSLPASIITSGTFSSARIPSLDASIIGTGTLPIARGGTGRTDGKAVALATPVLINGVSFDGSTNVTIPLSGSANSLTTPRQIVATGDASWSVTFDGSADVSSPLILAASGVAEGTYRSVTVSAKGIVTAGTNPTTLSGYGITDAQPLDADLVAIAGIAGTTGLLRKSAANTWTLDTSAYLTGNQAITFTGDVTGSGTTSVAMTLANSGVSAGTYKSVTVNAKGIITAGTNPTTLSGYGITDAVNSSDSRLTNSREWSAATVSSPQALDSGNTTRYAWTPQRVHEVADSKKSEFGIVTRSTITTNTSLSRVAKRGRSLIDTSASGVTITLNPANYFSGDVEEIVKLYPGNVLTITVSTGVISLPDGTSAATHTLTNLRGNLVLDYVSGTELRLSSIY